MEPQISEAQIDALKKEMLRKVLTKDAMERLARVRIGNPMLAAQLELYLVQVVQSGQVRGQIDDEKLKSILDAMASSKKKTSIRRM